ncbi:MAG: Rpn family recombination-promoting nuclease/putative transposase [Firmicutes bacterium]|nr:Rpn family recombination-promoting nuclease/putative transposase [Bacillota bacterium]
MTQEQVLFYPLYNDIMAKHIFGYQGRAKFLSYFLEDFFDLENGSLSELDILNSLVLDKYNIHDKGLELDVLVKLINGDMINLEFYSKYGRIAEIKSFVYITNYFRKELKAGDEYDSIKKISQINIVKNNKLHKTKELKSEYLVINKEEPSDQILPDLFQIYIFDLDTNNDESYNKNIRLKKWQLMFNATTDKEMCEAIKGDKIMEEIYDEMKRFSKNEWVNDFFNRDEFIKKSAEEDGIEQGTYNRNIEIAKNLLAMDMKDKDISKATGLSLDEINTLKDENN